jgi:molecular chaperone GrpE (heat shock protein)
MSSPPDDPDRPPAGADPASLPPDLERINRGLSATLDSSFEAVLAAPIARAGSAPAAEAGASAAGEETASPDRLADLTARVYQVQQAQAWLAQRLDEIDSAFQEAVRGVAREVGQLRRELLGDRKAAAVSAVLNALVPALEQLRSVRDRLEGGADALVARQLSWAADVLALPLRSLNIEEFSPGPGEPFDPLRMHCDGVSDGPKGAVVRTTRPGYRCQQTVLLPARVLVGRAAAPSPEALSHE